MVQSPYRPRRRRPVLLVIVVLVIGALVYHFAFRDKTGAPGGPPGDMAMPVTVESVQSETVRVWSEFSGRMVAVNAAEVRPEVSGRITAVKFQDGQNVRAGQELFTIDPRPFEAAVARAEAELAAANTTARFARLEEGRAAKMIKSKAIAQRLYDERANEKRIAEAAIKGAQAALKQARVDLEHAHVKAPISGRVGRAEITVGNVVEANVNAPVLTTIVSTGDIYADFEVDEQTYLHSIRATATDKTQEGKIPVQLIVQKDEEHPIDGTIFTFDNRIDPTSGTIRARAKFPNKDGALLPGMFVTVKLAGAKETTAVLVPETALGFDQNKKFAYSVDAENKVLYRELTLGDKVGNKRVVLSGLDEGDRVIVSSTMLIRPGAKVMPLTAEQAAAAAAEQEKAAAAAAQPPAEEKK